MLWVLIRIISPNRYPQNHFMFNGQAVYYSTIGQLVPNSVIFTRTGTLHTTWRYSDFVVEQYCESFMSRVYVHEIDRILMTIIGFNNFGEVVQNQNI